VPLSWDDLMGFGLGVLRLAPGAFWGMTLNELAAVVRTAVRPQETPNRKTLAHLMLRFPDERPLQEATQQGIP
jgi:uncharacterized phage protein (TIGR02216 family)